MGEKLEKVSLQDLGFGYEVGSDGLALAIAQLESGMILDHLNFLVLNVLPVSEETSKRIVVVRTDKPGDNRQYQVSLSSALFHLYRPVHHD